MRRLATLLIATGLLGLGWVLVTVLWQEPVTAALASQEQHALATQLRGRTARERSLLRSSLEHDARAYRRASREGEAMGRLTIPRIGLHVVLVDGTSAGDLRRGPGFYRGDYLPGEGRLVYVAGHRTTHGAPFSDLDKLRRGDRIAIALPYGSFTYRVTGHRVVKANAVWVLRSHRTEQLILQTCHPRFSASHRYLVYAEPIRRTRASLRPARPHP